MKLHRPVFVQTVFTLLIFQSATIAVACGADSANTDAIMTACKKECPNAKDKTEIFVCTELLEHGPKSAEFKKSKCHAAHEAYEKSLVQSANSESSSLHSKKK